MASPDRPNPTETTSLLSKSSSKGDREQSPGSFSDDGDIEAISVVSSSHLSSIYSKDGQVLASQVIGERLPYEGYTSIDWLHELAKDSFRIRALRRRRGLRSLLNKLADQSSGWFAAALIGALTACVAFLVDIAVATVADWKSGYCASNYLAGKEMCCSDKSIISSSPTFRSLRRSSSFLWYRGSPDTNFGVLGKDEAGEMCADWVPWTNGWYTAFAIYVAIALLYGIVSGSVTLLTKRSLPAAAPGRGDRAFTMYPLSPQKTPSVLSFDRTVGAEMLNEPAKPPGKVMYMASGSGIPEIKTVLSGFVIPNFLDLKVLIVKAVGSVFAVSTGMCLGKEGPFVHISTCVSYLVASLFPKYRNNGRSMRDMLSAGCASGLSVAFGAPIGGVLFSYEEISTYFPRKVLWRAFLCSLCAAIVLKQLNPTGTGKLVLFETKYGTSYLPSHYLIFILLGIAGGVFGGLFCKLNFMWSRWFRSFKLIKSYPVFEVALVVLATTLLQYPNPVTREPGDIIIKNLLVDCKGPATKEAWVCVHENSWAHKDGSPSLQYMGWLVYGVMVKLVLTIITFGVKVPSGIIIPALDAGAFFGRLVGQYAAGPNMGDPSRISPGIFAMVGAVAFLAGVSRMTISLAIIMLELTGELEYVVPYMVGILVAKWVADALEPKGVYDLAQTVLGHPFLDIDHALKIAQRATDHDSPAGVRVEALIPPRSTMEQITVELAPEGFAGREELEEKLDQLKSRGLLDAGLVLVNEDGILQGYLGQAELEAGLALFGTRTEASSTSVDANGSGMPTMVAETLTGSVKLIGSERSSMDANIVNLVQFVDKTPLTISAGAPIEYVVEMFSKLGLRYLCVMEEGSGKLAGVIIKRRVLDWLQQNEKH